MSDRVRIVKVSNDEQWLMVVLDDKKYFFFDNAGEHPEMLQTPGGVDVETSYLSLAERILEDLEKYGPDYMSPDSIIPWHYTMVENFCRMDHKAVEEMLHNCFLNGIEWTYDINPSDAAWHYIFGSADTRDDEIKKWLSECTHMQMTAACCIGNAYHSINIAFILAVLMENYDGIYLAKQIKNLARFIADNSDYGPASSIVNDFNNFVFYYGIHFEEDGNIINISDFEIPEITTEFNQAISAEILIGRNYYHYTNGIKDETQLFEIDTDDFCVADDEDYDNDDEDEDEEDDEEYDDSLSEFVPSSCWIKRLNACEDDYEAYELVVIEVDDDYNVTNISAVLEEVSSFGGGMFMIPGMELTGTSEYSEMFDFSDAVEEEISKLKEKRFLDDSFSLIGMPLPEIMLDDEESFAIQSAYRKAYMDVDITLDDDNCIDDVDYSTYQSTGSGYWDMFSRPQLLDDRHEEIVDAMLHILDKYSDDEYIELFEQ